MKKIDMNILQICPPRPSHVDTLPWKIQKSHFFHFHAHFRLFTLSQKKKNCDPLAYPHLKMSPHWLLKCKTFSSDWRFFCILSNVGEPVMGCRRWLWKEPVVMCGNWNVRQAMSQHVFRVTTFCINTCFQPFLIQISRIVHHALLKFSLCRNKPLP